MHNADKARIAACFCVSSAYYGRDLSDVVARLYQADLDDLNADQVMGALHALRQEPKRRSCPLPAEVRAYVNRDSLPAAPEQIAAKLASAISRYGYTRPAAAREFMGEAAWAVAEQLGGWVGICQRLQASEMGTFTAQARELARANLERPQAYAPPGRQLGESASPDVARLVSRVAGQLSAGA